MDRIADILFDKDKITFAEKRATSLLVTFDSGNTLEFVGEEAERVWTFLGGEYSEFDEVIGGYEGG